MSQRFKDLLYVGASILILSGTMGIIIILANLIQG